VKARFQWRGDLQSQSPQDTAHLPAAAEGVDVVEDGDKLGLQARIEDVPGHLDSLHQEFQHVHAQAHEEHVRPAAVLQVQGRPKTCFCHQLLPVFPRQVLVGLGDGRRKVGQLEGAATLLPGVCWMGSMYLEHGCEKYPPVPVRSPLAGGFGEGPLTRLGPAQQRDPAAAAGQDSGAAKPFLSPHPCADTLSPTILTSFPDCRSASPATHTQRRERPGTWALCLRGGGQMASRRLRSAALTHRPQERPSPRCTHLAVLRQKVDVVLIDLLHLLQLAAAQLPLRDVPVVDFGAQLPGQDSQGFSLWREGVEDLRRGRRRGS